jgi:hypothetical protein
LLAGALLSERQALAEGELPNEPRLFLLLATGPAFNYESWSPSGPNAGASYTGWAPVLEVAVGRRVRPRLVIAGDLQLAAVVNRTQSYLGGSYPLAGTLHFLDTLSAIADYTLWRHPRVHGGGGIGLLLMTDVDTQMGNTPTNLGLALSVHAGYQWRRARVWSIGVMGRLTFYRFGSDTPPPVVLVGRVPAGAAADRHPLRTEFATPNTGGPTDDANARLRCPRIAAPEFPTRAQRDLAHPRAVCFSRLPTFRLTVPT